MYPYYYPSYFNPMKPGMTPGMGMGPGMAPGAAPAPNIPGGMLPPIPGGTAGKPSGPVATPGPTIQPPPVDLLPEQGTPVTTDIGYTQAFLKTMIGQKVRVEFLIGTNLLTDRTGTLVDVGISYILIRIQETDDLMLGDIYSIKFVTFLK